MWDTAWAASKYGLFCAVDEWLMRQTAARGVGIPSVPFSGKGRFIWAKVAAMTRNILFGRSGFIIFHSDILPLPMCTQSRSDWLEEFKGHDSWGVRASGDEKDKMARAAAVPQIGSLSFSSIGFFNRLLRRVVLWDQW